MNVSESLDSQTYKYIESTNFSSSFKKDKLTFQTIKNNVTSATKNHEVSITQKMANVAVTVVSTTWKRGFKIFFPQLS